jgi:hypothetical protein
MLEPSPVGHRFSAALPMLGILAAQPALSHQLARDQHEVSMTWRTRQAVMVISVAALASTGSSQDRTRSDLFIPHPYATAPAEIMKNVVVALRRAHIDEAAKMPELAMRHNELRPRRILDVTSLARRTDYYMVELVNSANVLMANVATARFERQTRRNCLAPATARRTRSGIASGRAS